MCAIHIHATPRQHRRVTNQGSETMHETAGDLTRVQRLLDESYRAAGAHLREVITPKQGNRCICLAKQVLHQGGNFRLAEIQIWHA